MSNAAEWGTPFLGPTMTQACFGSQLVMFMAILDNLIRNKEEVSQLHERVRPIDSVDDEYDFIVVGGGAAGAVVAARLSENPEWKVLLLEAGPDSPLGAEVPAFGGGYIGTEIDWRYITTDEKYACQSTNGICNMAKGRALGGTFALNSMVYVRGVPQDYENWVALGNEGWSWDEVEPFFLRSENNREIERVGMKHHTTGGPLNIERSSWHPQFLFDVLDGAVEMGFEYSDDLNGDQITGFSMIQSYYDNGVRDSTARAFLRPNRNRENLHIALNTTVTRIIIEDSRAAGVEYYKDGEFRTTRASREIIVSGGTINSPQLLLLSGIGPKQHLESMNVPVIKDLPGVGENLQDHISVLLEWTINEPDYYDIDSYSALEYLTSMKGPLTSVGLDELMARLPSSFTTAKYPDIQLGFEGYHQRCTTTGMVPALKSNGRRGIQTGSYNIHPFSRGNVRLASNNPFEHPIIWGNFLSDPRDVDVTIEAIEAVLTLSKSEAMLRRNFTLENHPIAACSHFTPIYSKDYWTCVAHQHGVPIFHTVGTCKMGPASDPLAVVDPQLRVHGIEGLRVVDASIMPQVTSGNVLAPTIMIAERGADFIKKEWGVE